MPTPTRALLALNQILSLSLSPIGAEHNVGSGDIKLISYSPSSAKIFSFNLDITLGELYITDMSSMTS